MAALIPKPPESVATDADAIAALLPPFLRLNSKITFKHEGQVILALPEALGPLFEGRSLDIDDGGNLTVS